MELPNQQMNFNESTPEWGGLWTEKKLDAFARYVKAYLTIMKKQPYWKTIYFDGFAGCGDRHKNCITSLYRQLEITDKEERLYKGAAERVLTLSNNLSFDFHYFIDLKEESLIRLEKKLAELQKTKPNTFQYRSGDCNAQLLELSKAMKQKKSSYASLVLLDPFGMQINWSSIESLKGTRTDIWILVPTGVIVNRLLDKNCKLKHLNKLQDFFGMNEDEIKQAFYHTESQATLFGESEIIKKITKPIEKIAELYALRLSTIWSHVTNKPLRLENSRGVPIFHFVFASNNANAVKIAKQIINSI